MGTFVLPYYCVSLLAAIVFWIGIGWLSVGMGYGNFVVHLLLFFSGIILDFVYIRINLEIHTTCTYIVYIGKILEIHAICM